MEVRFAYIGFKGCLAGQVSFAGQVFKLRFRLPSQFYLASEDALSFFLEASGSRNQSASFARNPIGKEIHSWVLQKEQFWSF